MTKSEAIELVMLLRASFHAGGKVSEETAQVYESMILDLDFELAKAAIGRLIQSSKFLPSIAEIREAAREAEHGPRRSGLEAWGDVTRAIRLVGTYRTPVFTDPIVGRAVLAMGWREVCLGDNEPAIRARFIEAYEAMAARGDREAALSPELRLQPAQPVGGHMGGATAERAPLGFRVSGEWEQTGAKSEALPAESRGPLAALLSGIGGRAP
jgi:hypothetical protein